LVANWPFIHGYQNNQLYSWQLKATKNFNHHVLNGNQTYFNHLQLATNSGLETTKPLLVAIQRPCVATEGNQNRFRPSHGT
jgi:hypothetical protein